LTGIAISAILDIDAAPMPREELNRYVDAAQLLDHPAVGGG
jgi:hypothetical protein